MNAPTWEQIIDAVLVNDTRIGPFLKREITLEARKRAIRVLEALQAKEYERASQNAAERQNGANSAVTPTSPSGAGGTVLSVVEIDTDVTPELESVSSEIEALSVMADDERTDGGIVSDSTSPKASRGDSDTVYFDRPSRPPGLSKLRGEIWDWIEKNADGRAAANLSATIVHKATARARGVCAEVLTMYREWPDALTQEAS